MVLVIPTSRLFSWTPSIDWTRGRRARAGRTSWRPSDLEVIRVGLQQLPGTRGVLEVSLRLLDRPDKALAVFEPRRRLTRGARIRRRFAISEDTHGQQAGVIVVRDLTLGAKR